MVTFFPLQIKIEEYALNSELLSFFLKTFSVYSSQIWIRIFDEIIHPFRK